MTLLFLVVGVLGMITPHGVRMIRGVFNDTVVLGCRCAGHDHTSWCADDKRSV